MKYVIKTLLISLITFQYSYSQTDSLSFKIYTNYSDGKSYLTKTKIIPYPNSKIDVYFFQTHFNLLYGLPKDLIKENLKNQEITKWRFEDKPKELQVNWKETFKYDSDGRLIEYKYSSCRICSQFPYGYKLIYNQNNDIIEQQVFPLRLKINSENHSVKVEIELENKMIYKIKLTYDNLRNIIKLEKTVKNEPMEVIELVK